MSSSVLSASVPLVSALLGLAITYWINIRTRKANHIDDLLNEAIAAVAVAECSQHYITELDKPDGLPDADHKEEIATFVRMGRQNFAQRSGEAREALARLVHHEGWVRDYYMDSASMTQSRPQEIIERLVEAKRRRNSG